MTSSPSNIDLIDVFPPGLYEAVLREKADDDVNAVLAHGGYITRFEGRTLDDIRALGGNDDHDERCFATVARLSEINSGLYPAWLRAHSSRRRATSSSLKRSASCSHYDFRASFSRTAIR